MFLLLLLLIVFAQGGAGKCTKVTKRARLEAPSPVAPGVAEVEAAGAAVAAAGAAVAAPKPVSVKPHASETEHPLSMTAELPSTLVSLFSSEDMAGSAGSVSWRGIRLYGDLYRAVTTVSGY